ncbi:uncharacterized protein NEMAJ01_1566 [Nematocida major]|uniref:uncharacterized protein n=1 Tax=Nematocida major TaxID=1912982 RepID=UPI0020074E61|nr:uncharacterized protein NEMAJ01_1566 [Nematocida major]KAH9386670.1 hypothetical protein NEMAJ01_1566 [Nematocida major]
MQTPFIQRVAAAVEQEYPKERADSSWDNTGILLEFDNTEESLLLCIDLTEEVLSEAVSEGITTILAYHPPIFSAIKKITRENVILHGCINSRISVYSPHTALDGGKNGINYWMGQHITGLTHAASSGYVQIYRNESTIESILEELAAKLSLDTIRYSLGTGHSLASIPEVVAIGAGASSRPIKRLVPETRPAQAAVPGEEASPLPESSKIQLAITGEASHHDLLYFKKCGVSVLLLEHSRSERGFLQVLHSHLQAALPGARVKLSAHDRDPVYFYTKSK